MASLWTPEGEHRVEHESAPVGEEVRAERPDTDDETELSEAEVLEEMAELERQLVAAPAKDVIANHCYGLFQLAALQLAQRPPNLEPARLAIDALGAIVEHLGARLEEHEATLSEGLAQIRLAFVQLSGDPNLGTAPES